MKLSHPLIAIVSMAACIQIPASAAEGGSGTWRCGNTYTDQPCKGGKVLGFEDARSAVQKREADGTVREARAAANRLERDRIRLEQTEGRRQPVLIDNGPRAKQGMATSNASATVARKKKGKKDTEHFSAHDPVATERAKLAKSSRTSRTSRTKS